MDIWMVAVLVAWLPVGTALALLVGRSMVKADRRERVLRRPRPGGHAPVVSITTARRPHRHHGHRHGQGLSGHRSASSHDRHGVAS